MKRLQGRFLLADTADRIALVGIYDGRKILAERKCLSRAPTLGWLVRAISEVETETGTRISELSFFASGVGPGGFTSVRVGLSLMKAISQSLDKPLVGVNRLESAALGHAVLNNRRGKFFVRLPAARDLEYAALYRIEPDALPVCERPPAALSSEEMSGIEIPAEARMVSLNPDELYLGIPLLAALKAEEGRAESGLTLQPVYLRGATLGSPRPAVPDLPFAKRRQVR